MSHREWDRVPKPNTVGHAENQSYRSLTVVSCFLVALLANPISFAQYVFNENNADEAPGIKYFGSAKDANGALLPNVSIQISAGDVTYVVVTDEQGRFRENVMLSMVLERVTLTCFKEGYQLVSLNKRHGPSARKQTVQVDCVLRASEPK